MSLVPLAFDAARDRIAVLSPQARSIGHLAGFFPDARLTGRFDLTSATIYAGWGLKRSSLAARLLAGLTGRRMVRFEDGFLRSVGLGKAGAPPYSIVVDDLGIYYDARRPSRLERLIATAGPADAAIGAEVRRRIVDGRITKYNATPYRPLDLPRSGRRRILLVDQVAGDHSIPGALASAGTFARMLAAARAIRPEAELLVRSHPDVTAGYRRGHLPTAGEGLHLVPDAAHPHAVLDVADEVWTVSSQIGFEAAMRGLPVVTFGMPFYAGWGLTDDRAEGEAAVAARARRAAAGRSIDMVVAAALVAYPRYADPADGRGLDVHGAIDRLEAAMPRRGGA